MTNLADLTTGQLQRIIAIKEQIETLQGEIDSFGEGGGEVPTSSQGGAPKKHRRRRSAAVRARMAVAQKARWAKLKDEKATTTSAKKKDRRSSPATRAKLAAAAKARWARVKAEGKKTL